MIEAPVSELMKPLNLYDVVFEPGTGGVPESVAALAPQPDTQHSSALRVTTDQVSRYAEIMAALAASNARIVHTEGRSRSLEEYYMGLVREAEARFATGASA
jgi:hypothetical protein